MTSSQPTLFLDDLLAEEPQQALSGETAPVMLPLALHEPYDYLLPQGESFEPGDFVLVPLGAMKRIGVIWHKKQDQPERAFDAKKLKAVIEKIDVPPLPAVNLAFADWVANYTLAPKGMILHMMMSARLVFEAQEPRWGYRASGTEPTRATAARARVLALTANGAVWPKKKLMDEASVSAAVIDGLAEAGVLTRAALPRALAPEPKPDFMRAELTTKQTEAADALKQTLHMEGYSATLLDGVTGSGKTEVYFEAVAEALAQGRQVLILLPEIALTNQFLERFERRFGCRPAEWHSSVTQPARAKVWRGVAEGDVRAVVGARSALFLPFSDLGLIVVDEEHDPSFKQEERAHYQARDMAVVRASLGKFPIILSSATPSVETMVNANKKRYGHVSLPMRFTGRDLPKVGVVDLKASPPEKGAWLSQPLIDEVNETLARGEQALLFLNRRGYAPLTLCRSCGHRFTCPQCTAYLVEHRAKGRLVCHHCGFSLPFPKNCPTCHKEGLLIASGPGVERVMEEAQNRWPEARLAALSSDLLPTTNALREVLTRIADGDVDIIIGTQLVSKGHNFPKLSFVGVVDGDLSLAASAADPRASERTFHLLHQVMGRAGRFHTEGRGLIQTHYPDHPVMQALSNADRDAFYEAEIGLREMAGLPPYGRLAALVVSGKTREEAEDYARGLALIVPEAENISVLGPVEAPLSIIRGRHRQRLLVKAAREANLQGFLRAWLGEAEQPRGGLQVQVDVDPYSFL